MLQKRKTTDSLPSASRHQHHKLVEENASSQWRSITVGVVTLLRRRYGVEDLLEETEYNIHDYVLHFVVGITARCH